LLHGQETTLHGDKAYYKADDKLQWELSGGRYLVNKSGKRTDYWDGINRTRSRVRAMVEHPFHTIKRLWRFTTVRYRSLAKNPVRVFALGMLADLFRVRHRLLRQGT
jgi:IS5 family transposase